jgi:two-component system sensor kinase FixL
MAHGSPEPLKHQPLQAALGADALHALYENTPGFIAITGGAEHSYLFANAAYNRLVGDRQLLGRPVADVMPELVDQGFIDLLDHVYETGEPHVGANTMVEFRALPDAPAERRYLNFVYQPVRDPAGRIVGIFCEGQDVTAHRTDHEQLIALQAKLIHLSRVGTMSVMAATLAHELNQPLTAVANYIGACRRMLATDFTIEQLDDPLRLASESTDRAAQIIRRIRQSTKRGTTSRERFDLCLAVEEAVALVQMDSCDSSIEFRAHSPVQVLADRVQIQQVIINLLRNACEAAAAVRDGLVIVRVSLEGDEVVVSVDDTGAGVGEEAAESLFQWAASSKPDGMGIGLSISRTIIEMHRGRIWHDRSDGQGARFSFSLPLGTDV